MPSRGFARPGLPYPALPPLGQAPVVPQPTDPWHKEGPCHANAGPARARLRRSLSRPGWPEIFIPVTKIPVDNQCTEIPSGKLCVTSAPDPAAPCQTLPDPAVPNRALPDPAEPDHAPPRHSNTTVPPDSQWIVIPSGMASGISLRLRVPSKMLCL